MGRWFPGGRNRPRGLSLIDDDIILAIVSSKKLIEDREKSSIKVQILKYNYLFWLITVVPFKIDLKSLPQSDFVSINTSSARLVSF